MKQFEARPWLIALVTATAAVTQWAGQDDSILVTLARYDFEYLIPVPWVLWPLIGAGVAALIATLVAGRTGARDAPRDVVPTVGAAPGHPDSDVAPDSDTSGTGDCSQPAPGSDVPVRDIHAGAPPDKGAPQSPPAESALFLELDAKGRILKCHGAAAYLLAADPPSLVGTSILKLMPERVRKPLVAAVRGARQEPDQDVHLPPVRLQTLGPGGTVDPTPPLKLILRAHSDGTLSVRGRAVPARRARPLNLDAADERFSRVFHSSPDAILIIRNHDGLVIDFNEGFTRLIGYTREQAIGAPESDLGLWLDESDRRQLMETLARDRNVTDVEVQVRTADGTVIPVELSLRYIELGGELCVLCIGRDISKRLDAELAARSSEEKFARVFNQSPDAIVILRADDYTIRDVNIAFAHGSGYSAEELVGQPVSKFNPVMNPDALAATFRTLKEQGRIANQEMMFRTKDGKDLPALVSATRTEIDGESSILCIVKDVSELRHAQEQLRRSEERFRGAFENAPIGILLLDTQGHIFQANRFATELLHYAEQSLSSTHISRLVPSDDRVELKEQLERLIRGGDATFRSERRLLCADGLEIWTNCHIVVQRARDGEALYCIMQVADITEMKTSQRRMERLAFYDTLTELANRRLFNDRLQQAVEHCRRHQERAALLYLDLDQFKRVNDTLGHESGDALLREVADRLVQCVRKEDTVGRPGGDEFTVLLYGVEAPDHAGQVAEKILRELQRPISISGHQLVVTTSIGITVIPDDGVEPNALLKNADLAMYRAKEKGRNNYQFYSEELNTNAVRRLRTEYELRRALERSEFELHFQPTVSLANQSIVGVECLLRWNHPERGTVYPDDFIGIAEETGAIVEIGNWVIQEACAAGRLMLEQRGAPLCIAVNISPRQFRDPNLVNTIRHSLRRARLDPSSLELEITETMLMQDVEAAAEIVARLHKLGVSLAIDDFGTGYSSLNYLKKFPISTVKVDRSFVTDIPESSDDMEITAAVIAMAHRLKMQVVAEGVETQAQLDFLSEQNCDYAQGYLFARAMPLKDVRRLLGPNVRLLRGKG